MLSENAVRRLKWFGMFLAPIVLVKGAALVIGASGPAGADAAFAPAAASGKATGIAAATAWTDAQRRAAEHVAMLRDRETPPSPLYYTIPHAGAAGQPQTDVAPVEFNVQAIMSSINGRTAVINNGLYRVGEIVRGSDWSVEFVNSDQRSVILRNVKTGETQTATVPVPKIEAPKPLEMNVEEPLGGRAPAPRLPFAPQPASE